MGNLGATGQDLKWDPPKLAFETDYIDTPGVSYDVSPDGNYLYVLKSVVPTVRNRLFVIANWWEELRRVAPAEN